MHIDISILVVLIMNNDEFATKQAVFNKWCLFSLGDYGKSALFSSNQIAKFKQNKSLEISKEF